MCAESRLKCRQPTLFENSPQSETSYLCKWTKHVAQHRLHQKEAPPARSMIQVTLPLKFLQSNVLGLATAETAKGAPWKLQCIEVATSIMAAPPRVQQ